MIDGWRNVTLTKIAIVIDSRHKTPKYDVEGLPMVRAVDINGAVLDLSDTRKVTQSVYDDFSKGRDPEIGDILISRVGHYLGKVSYVSSNELFCMGQNIALLIPKESSKYLFYFLMSPIGKKQIDLFKVGAAQPTLSLKSIKQIPINLPPLPEQKAIAHILGTLDDKIELNRQMNQTLEAMAQALFKSWFVDFDPVMDNALAAGPDSYRDIPDELQAMAEKRQLVPDSKKLISTNPELVSKFPSSFVFNEALGKWIPEGWEVKSLYDSADFINGASFKSEYFTDKENGMPIIKIVELKNGITEQTKFTTQQMSTKYFVTKGDLLYSWSGSPDTSLSAFLWSGEDGWLNQHVFNVVTLNDNHKAFCFSLLNELKTTLIAIAKDKQTTGLGHVTVKDMKNLHVVHPTSAFDELINNSIGPIFKKIFQLQLENITLTQLRDRLLPELISGRVRVKEGIEKMKAYE